MKERRELSRNFVIEGMTCPSCERKIERAVDGIPGVADYVNAVLTVKGKGDHIPSDRIISAR